MKQKKIFSEDIEQRFSKFRFTALISGQQIVFENDELEKKH